MSDLKYLQIITPIHVMLPRKTTKDKKVMLNYNIDRNLHHHAKNECKSVYTENLKDILEGVKLVEPVSVTYELHRKLFKKDGEPMKNAGDRMNVVSIVSKYMFDAMQKYGTLSDDNDFVIYDEYLKPTIHTDEVPHIVVTFESTRIGEDV